MVKANIISMAKENKKNQQDFKAWLLKFEKQIGRGVVVSLLIDKGKIDFLSCVDSKRYLQDLSGDEEEYPSINLKDKIENLNTMDLDYKDYIG